VDENVGIAMPEEPFLEGNLHAAYPKLPVVDKTVDIVTETYAESHFSE
jgi:hypothetical protein